MRLVGVQVVFSRGDESELLTRSRELEILEIVLMTTTCCLSWYQPVLLLLLLTRQEKEHLESDLKALEAAVVRLDSLEKSELAEIEAFDYCDGGNADKAH